MLSGNAKVTGLIGWPVSHSLSPRLHNFWLEHYRIDGAYIPIPIEDEFETVIKVLPKMGLRGYNVTIPYKEQIVPLMNQLDEAAKAIGSVNTVIINHDGTMMGMNTDAYGFRRNLSAHIRGKKKAVVLGAGGAARAICYSLIEEGYVEIIVINRTEEKAQQLAEHFGGRLVVHPWDNREKMLDDTDLLVNATSLGMAGKAPLELSLQRLPSDAVVTDIVYHPLQTPLLRDAKKHGNTVVDGLGMLIHQAIHGFRSWYGMKPDITPELREMLAKALGEA